MSISYSHRMKVYVGRQKDGNFKVACLDEDQTSQHTFSEAESLKSYLARISQIKDTLIEIYDGIPTTHENKDVDRIPTGEFIQLVKGLEKKCTEGRVKVDLT